MKRIMLLLSACLPFLAFGQSFEFGVSGGISTTTKPDLYYNGAIGAPAATTHGGAIVPAFTVNGVANIGKYVQAGISFERYGLYARYKEIVSGESANFNLTKAPQNNIVAELNVRTAKKDYFFIGGAGGIDTHGKLVWGAQAGYEYSPIRRLGIFAQASMRQVFYEHLFTFPITAGVRVKI